MTTKQRIQGDYFAWLLGLISGAKTDPWEYEQLLLYLHSREFYWKLPMDENRAVDGIDLRNRFIDETGRLAGPVLDALDGPCSVLEMLVALAVRIETHIMHEEEEGDRAGEWFWIMIMNLELLDQKQLYFEEAEVSEIIDNLLERKYRHDGLGGLFYIDHCERDLRKVEIWYQMNWYFVQITGN